MAAFSRWAELYLAMYWILLCEAHRRPENAHYEEAVRNLEYVEYLRECIKECPGEVYADRRAVRRIGEIEGRVTRWHEEAGTSGAIS